MLSPFTNESGLGWLLISVGFVVILGIGLAYGISQSRSRGRTRREEVERRAGLPDDDATRPR